MRYRDFGRSGLRISETGFGAWAIGGESYGPVDKAEALRALAVAGELGCNFIDTAAVYGNSEQIIGEFLRGQRDKWLLASKYSGGEASLTDALEAQLRRLGTDVIDIYQIHWVPRGKEEHLYEELYRLRRDGKVRLVGVSLYNINDIDYVIERTNLDCIQLPCNLLEPLPYLPRLKKIADSGMGVIVRSSLKGGLLSGKYTRETQFADDRDQRSKLSRAELDVLFDQLAAMRFLEQATGSLALAAARYPLSFEQTSTVLLGTKNATQSRYNFGEVPGGVLDAATLQRIREVQQQLGLWPAPWRLWLQGLVNTLRL